MYFTVSFFFTIIVILGLFKIIDQNKLIPKLIKNGISEQYFKSYVTHLVCQYNSIIDRDANYKKTYTKIWTTSFDSRYPSSGWGTRFYKPIVKLDGKGSELIPEGTIGYMIDSSSNAHTWDNNAYSYTLISDSLAHSNDTLRASVFCYVSYDFDGDWVMLRSEGSGVQTVESVYDLNKREEWQFLELNANCNDGEAKAYMYIAKYNATSFNKLKGYVIFAYPTYSINRYKLDNFKLEYFSELTLNNKEVFVSEFLVLSSISSLIINFITSCNVDTTVSQSKFSNDLFLSPRLNRWTYGLDLYIESYSFWQKIFGRGFYYMNSFGQKFLNNKDILDYPHNPIISILLYSGLLGLFFYLFLIINVCYLYWIYRKHYWHFALCFVISYFFSFFSANNPFDHPILGFFILLPYLIHYSHKLNNK